MKMQQCVVFVKKTLKKNMWKLRTIVNLIQRWYRQEYRDDTHSIYNVVYKNLIAFYNGSNYDYHFIIKELAEEF